MDLVKGVRMYIDKMVEETGPGMKCLLMSKETTGTVSMAYSQSEMLAKEVYLFERIERRTSTDPLKYLKCIVFIRPTAENIQLLQKELRSPLYGQYHLYFCNIVKKTDIKLLAEADEHEVVRDVQELYADYVAIGDHLFSLNLEGCYTRSLQAADGMIWREASLEHCVQGISSVLLCLKRCPTLRYQGSSEMCKRLAEGIRQMMAKEGKLFTTAYGSSTLDHSSPNLVLLILDRRIDPITPLLNQWTYQAMLHELLTINNNRVDLSRVENIRQELKEVVISPEYDDFYAQNMYLNYGEIGSNIKQLMEEFQARQQGQQKVETIADMKDFIEYYPQFKKMSGTVSKHVTLIGELSRLVKDHSLFEVSEAEQELACRSDHSESVKKVKRLITPHDKTRDVDALRLVLLYALRYDKHSNSELQTLKQLLRARPTISSEDMELIQSLVRFASAKKVTESASDLLSTEQVKAFTKKVIKGLKEVENIYTQHTPVLKDILEELCRNKLKAQHYPYLGGPQIIEKPREILVFMIGGATYEESLVVHQLNESLTDTRIILGSSRIHNTESFLKEVRLATSNPAPKTGSGTHQRKDMHLGGMLN